VVFWSFDEVSARATRKTKRGKLAGNPRPKSRRGLLVESLEQRAMMAISPTLAGIIPNDGDLIINGQTRHVAPNELTFRFSDGQAIDPATLANGIQIVRSGGDGVYGNGNDSVIVPGFIGIGVKPNEVVVRFADSLPDDSYRITVVGAGPTPLKNSTGDVFNSGANTVTNLRLDLPPEVAAVVPQPITRNGSGQLVQNKNQIVVYFNGDTLNTVAAQNPSFYQLIFTASTAKNQDDVIYNPTSVVYDAAANRATLTFAGDLSTLGSGVGTYRLRVGDDRPNVPTPIVVDAAIDAGSSLSTAKVLPTLGTQSQIINGGSILSDIAYLLNFPGGVGDIGHRDIPLAIANHYAPGSGPDTTQGITTFTYDFRTKYGLDPEGNQLFNVITEAQKQRAREIFTLWGHYTGVNFVEKIDVDTTGVFADFGIVTGDPRAIDPTAPTGRNGVFALSNDNLAVIDNAETWGSSEFGGAWFKVAMHEIGKLLGLGDAYELPPLTIMGSAGETVPTPAEVVAPGDGDIVHGQNLFRPESRDIDLYRFDVTTSGRFSAEILAERRVDSSMLDGVVTLFDSTGKIVARNDNYFSKDSFLDLDLVAGRYYVGVSSTGNTNYNPLVADSGLGGTTEGSYQLRLNFSPTPSGSLLVDTTGTILDGDRDGVPGGAFNFWYEVGNASNTIYVDKIAPTAGADGSLAKPYNNIAVALAAAAPGSSVRVVGNGGADGNLDTLGDNRAYEIGFDNTITPSVPLADGTSLDVPQNVTLVVEAGAVFKLSQANINVGSFSQGVDLSGGAIQILGTPQRSAIFTSYHHEQVGVDTNPRPTTPSPGDWGGLVFRHDSDNESQGIFQNYVAYANIGFGGGSVVVDSVQQTFSPIHLEKARPTILSNLIGGSADAAISADPDSFEETLYRDDGSNLTASVRFTGDYRRVGPDIHSNTLLNNSINGLFVRIRTDAGQPIDKLTVSGRFDDTDIVHVIAENLFVLGTPGGPTLRADSTREARLDAQLVVDPGLIVKMQGSRIEVELGAQLIAEGRAATQVVFTSLSDDRYGAGGVFDTTNDGSQSAPAAGDWGGFFFHPTSKGSIDRALVTFAGGDTPIEGGFANFNAVEIHQADVRITNSVLERNADGFESATDRNGRGVNSASTIFVGGAQPIIVNNILRDNRGDAISINASALTSTFVGDRGRSTGAIDRFTTFDDNHGPLVQENKLQDNDVNGMGVRGATNKSNIDFRIGPGLSGNAQAVAAFELAAQAWEAILKDPITLTLDLNFRSLSNPSVLGQTLSVFQFMDFDEVRQLMMNDAQPGNEILYDLPTFAQLIAVENAYLDPPPLAARILPSEYGALPEATQFIQPDMRLNRANLLALGVSPAELVFQPSAYDPVTPIDGTIEFNSDFAFDFDPSDGIGAGLTDFVGVAIHEIGHALGFTSYVDVIDTAPSLPIPIFMTPLDLFRLPAGYGFEDFKFAPRVLNPGFPNQVFYDGGQFNSPGITVAPLTIGDIPLSRGANRGDGSQASHWRDNALLGAMSEIGIMDPNLGPAQLSLITQADIRAFDLLGYDLISESAPITTETIWDDTDIVHVVRDEIVVSDFHTFGGLRLQSSPTESLVVKLDGELAGFTSNGQKLDIDDRIGGTLQVLGTPGHPVVMTSLIDNTVGAGTDISGHTQVNTVAPVPQLTQMNIDFRVGPSLANRPEVLAAFNRAAALWEAFYHDPITVVLDIDFPSLGGNVLGQTFSETDTMAYDAVRQLMINDAGPNEAIVNQIPTFAQLQTTLPAGWTVSPMMKVNRANLLAMGVPRNQLGFTPSIFDPTTGVDGNVEFNSDFAFDFDPSDGITAGFYDFVGVAAHEIGHALGFVSATDDVDFTLPQTGAVMLQPLDLFRLAPGAGATNFTTSPRILDPAVANQVFYDGGIYTRPDVTIAPLTIGDIPLSTGRFNGDGQQASHWKDNGLLGIMTEIGLLDPNFGTAQAGLITSADVRAFDLMGYDFQQKPKPAWRGIRLDEYTNDRNVDVANEQELAYTGTSDANNLPSKAQFLGTLAPNEKNGDENRRLGFDVHGFVSFDRSGDADVYSFNGQAGTEVWLDIDRTSVSLDTVVELIDANGAILARSDNSVAESVNSSLLVSSASVKPMTLQKSLFSSDDTYTTNVKDAGMRLVLPGVVGTTNTYYVRVRSSSANLANPVGGQTSGGYQLQIRLRELDEVAGSTVRYSDIRYATRGIEVLGGPSHSPLTGEIGRAPLIESINAFDPLFAQDLGNILATDRSTISLASRQETFSEVQWYRFTLDFQSVQAIPGYNDGPKGIPLIFDVDYADGIARPDMTMALFEQVEPTVAGLKFIALGRSSSIGDDQPPPLGGSGANDLSRGSFGKLDPFLGSIQLVEGTIKTYYVAITSDAMLPSVLDGLRIREPANKLTRLEPVNSVKRVVEDHIGSVGYVTGNPGALPPNLVLPTSGPILPLDPMLLPSVIEASTLEDLVLFVSTGRRLTTVNPATGAPINAVGNYAGPDDSGRPITDIAIRTDGYMFGVQSAPQGDQAQNAGQLMNINPGTARLTEVGQDHIVDEDPTTPTPKQLTATDIDAIAYARFDIGGQTGAGDGNSEHYDVYYSVHGAAGSVLFLGNATDGEGANDNEIWGPVSGDVLTSVITGVTGFTTGMAFVDGTLYGVSDIGEFYSIDPITAVATIIGTGFATVPGFSTAFSGLTAGPVNLGGGSLVTILLAINTDGQVIAIDSVTGAALPVFDDVDQDGAPDMLIETGATGATGLAIPPSDFNLWHPTSRRTGLGNPGHGINATHDNTRFADAGDASFYFGFELGGGNFGVDPALGGDLSGYGTLQQPGPQGRPAWLDDTLFAQLQIGNNFNLPGGAQGNLITLPFSLEGVDLPALYFNYYFRGTSVGAVASMSVTVDGGENWTALPVNFFDAVTVGTEAVDDNFWRQARVDLNQFAGEEEVQLRFEFASEGGNNPLEGLYIDDIIVGSVARGEIATGPLTSQVRQYPPDSPQVRPGNIDVDPAVPDIFIDPITGEPLNFDPVTGDPIGPDYIEEARFSLIGISPNPGNPSQVLTGAYQLEIRRATDFAQVIDPLTGASEIVDQFDAADRLDQAITLVAPEATAITVDLATVSDGDTFTISDGVNPAITFEFDNDDNVTGTNTPVTISLMPTAREVTLAIEAAVNLVDALPNVPFNVHASHNSAGDAFYLDGAVGPITTVDVTFNLVETILDGQFFTLTDGVNQRTFEFDRNGSVAAGRIAIPISFESPQGIAKRMREAINAANGASFTASASTKATSARVDLNNVANFNTLGTPGMGVLQFGTHTFYAAPGDQILDGETFTISDGFNRRVFEFDLDGTVTLGNIAVPIVGMETSAEIARLMFAAVNSQTGPTFLAFAQPPVADRVDIARAVSVAKSVVSRQFKAIEYNGLGDGNAATRDQGQIILQGNRISFSSEYGIVSDAGFRDAVGSHPGTVRNLRELNNARLVPGVVIANNVIASSGIAGILFSGDPSGGNPNDDDLSLAPIPFGRIVNNTIYGGGQGFGIQVRDNASPTILNNILANLGTGIQVSANSSTTVVGATLYQGNSINTAGTTTGSFPILLGPNDPLFVNAATGNFNLAAGSRAIDASLNSLADRPAMTTVSAPLGIGPSPILAPLTDLTGKLRNDDPSKPSEPGLGQNVFKDRGALDRSDFTGPTAALLNPLDNDASGTDQDPTLNTVLLAGQSLQNFSVRLIDDTGTGIDDSTVASNKFVLRRDGVVLVENVDYSFGYDGTNDVARFTPLVGVWLTDHVYTITVDNTAATGIKDQAGNRLLPNQAVNQTLFTVTMKPVDFGDAPEPYATLLAANGARHIIVPGLFLGAGVTDEGNGQPSSSAAADLLDDGVVFTNALRPGAVGNVTVTASTAGRLDAWIDFNGDGDWSDAGEQIFTNQALVAGANALSFNVSSAAVTTTYARFRLSSTGNLAPTGLANDGEVEDYQVEIPSVVAYSLVLTNAATGNELPKDAQGRYVALAGTTIQAQVYVDDLRNVGAAGGVQAAFADLVYDTDLIDWVANSLTIGAGFTSSSSGTILEGQKLIDEAGGLSPSPTPTGANPKRLLFTVNGQMKSNAAPGSSTNLSLDRAGDLPAHDTFVFGVAGVVPSTYQSVEVVVPQFAWQNPSQLTDSKSRLVGNLDVDNNGSIVGLDALLIINQLNSLPPYVDPITHALPATPTAPNLPPFYVDVNGDGFLTGADALAVINYLNLIAAEAQAGGSAASLRVGSSSVEVSAASSTAANAAAGISPGAGLATRSSTSASESPSSPSQRAGIALAAHLGANTSTGNTTRFGGESLTEAAKLSTHAAPARLALGRFAESFEDGDLSESGLDFGLSGGLKARGRVRWDRAVADVFAKHADRDDALALDDSALDDIVAWRAGLRR